MRKFIALPLVSLLSVAPAMAQESQNTGNSSVPQTTIFNPTQQQSATRHPQPIEEDMRSQLAGAGYTDIEIVPISFAVRAKNSDGNPVRLMFAPITSDWQFGPQDHADRVLTSDSDQ